MEAQVTLMIAIMASFGLTAVQPQDGMAAKSLANEMNENKIQENFYNLFESISKNDVIKSDTYRNILVQQAEGEQQAFDTMKERLEFSRQRNGQKQKINDHAWEKSAAFKREARRELYFSTERKFVDLYGNDPESSGKWECVRNFSSDIDRLKQIALQAHERAYMLPTKSIVSITIEEKTLDFSYPKFKPIQLDTIVYKFRELPRNPLYMSKGLAPDCIFYLTKWDNHALIFRLGIHYCDIKVCS